MPPYFTVFNVFYEGPQWKQAFGLSFVFILLNTSCRLLFNKVFNQSNFKDPYNVLLAIATNIPMLLVTGFVIQGHI